MDRRRLLMLMMVGAVCLMWLGAACTITRAAAAGDKSPRKKYNVLFLAVDDLNDWVGCLGGHPQAKTPNIDKFAGKGVLFEQAYAAAVNPFLRLAPLFI